MCGVHGAACVFGRPDFSELHRTLEWLGREDDLYDIFSKDVSAGTNSSRGATAKSDGYSVLHAR